MAGRATQRRRLALLALLARATRRTLTRERILAYLWPEASPDAARRLLSESVYVIRRELGGDVVRAVGDELSLAEEVACDADEFLEACARGDHAEAVARYGGPLLDGWYIRDAPEFERWADAERAELAVAQLRALRALTAEREARGDWSAAARGWQAIVRLDPYGSTAVLHGARALAAAGEPAGALQLIAAHEALLRDELGVELDADLSALAAEIREGRLRPRRPSPPPLPTDAGSAAGGSPSGHDPGPVSDHGPVADQPTRPAPNAPSSPTAPITPGIRRRRRGAVPVVAIAAVALLVGWLGSARRTSRSATAERAALGALDPRRIAVLPFEHGADSSLDYLADGLAEGLVRELQGVPTLRLFSHDAARQFVRGAASADSVGRALGAGTVIGATVRRSENRVRVVARLVDAATGEQVATIQVEQAAGELFALEDALVRHTADALRRRLGSAVRLREERRAAAARGHDDRALALLLQAERIRRGAEEMRRSMTEGAGEIVRARARLAAADSMLAVAESLDARWARPPIERGWVAVVAGRLEHGPARVVALSPGIGHVERALALLREDPAPDSVMLASALHLRGVLRLRTATAVQTFRPEGTTLRLAGADLEQAVALDSTLAPAWAALSTSRWIRGDFEGAEGAANHALSADAFLEDAGDVVGWAWRSAYSRGDRDAATRWCRRGHELLPQDWHFIECELTILRLDAAGLTRVPPDPARAWALVRQLEHADTASARVAGRPYSPIFRRLVAAAVTAAAGGRDSARAVLAREAARVRGDAELSTDILYDAAFVHITLGERARAGELLAQYLRARPDLDSLIARDPTMRAATAARDGERGRRR